MKKVVIVDSFEGIGGGQQFLKNLIKLFSDRYIFYVITFSKTLYDTLSKEGIEVHYISKKRYFGFLKVKKTVKVLNPDLIILNGQFEAHFSFLFPFRKIIFVRHTSLTMTTVLKKILYFIEALFFADSIVVVNDFIVNQFPFFIRNKITVIHNWSSLPCKTNTKVKKLIGEKFNILYCGRLVKDKNVDLIIEACKDLKDLVDLHIVGIGEEYNKLITKYASFNNIHFHGYVENNSIKYYYEISDIYISMSKFEAFPLSVLDAFCYGLPSILSRIPAHIDISKNGECAFLCDSNVEDIKNAIIKLINDVELRKKLSMNAAQRAQDFAPETAKEKYSNLFENLIKKNYKRFKL